MRAPVQPPVQPFEEPAASASRAEWSLMEQAYSRAAGAHRIEGNSVRQLRDAVENYPAWLDAIAAAERYVYFEAYIMRDDVAGRRFADALMAKAREGVSVYLLYDWLGAFRKTPARFWRMLRDGGIEVRRFNPFTLASPLGWVHRDHRKSLVVDGRVGFITGLCVGDEWVGDPSRGIAPWRDTGIEVRGPAVAEIERAFRRVWGMVGPPIPHAAQGTGNTHDVIPAAGNVAMRVVASEPWRGKLLRLDDLVAGAARETLWLTDAYFAAMPSYVQSLRAAALDGVDVRLLVPGGTDIPVLRPLSRAGYRPLLEAGVRVFEWNGPMIHAKSAVADGRWARVGSSNLNIASWLGNYELDAVVEDTGFAQAMAQQYVDDLANATEVVLRNGRAARTARPHRAPAHTRLRARGTGSAGRAVAGAIRLGNTVTAAVTNHRVLEPADARVVAGAGAILVAAAVAVTLWPRLFAIPFAVLSVWFGWALLVRAYRLHLHLPLHLPHAASAAPPSDRVMPRAEDRTPLPKG